MIVLLSPAKSLNEENTCVSDVRTQPMFNKEANHLAEKLSKLSAKRLGNLMKLSPALADLNYYRYQEWNNAKQQAAAVMFMGDAYRGLDVATLTKKELNFAQDHLRILSGLYGVLKPLDKIRPYRLEMGTKWPATKKTPNLYAFWGDKIHNIVEQESRGSALINVASKEYSKAAKLDKLKVPVYTMHFRNFKNGDYKVIMTFAKHARGAMARFIIKESITDPEHLKAFDYDGYIYNPKLSDKYDWVFTKG